MAGENLLDCGRPHFLPIMSPTLVCEVYKSLTEMLEKKLCFKGEETYHRLQCLKRECGECVVKLLQLVLVDTSEQGHRQEVKQIKWGRKVTYQVSVEQDEEILASF